MRVAQPHELDGRLVARVLDEHQGVLGQAGLGEALAQHRRRWRCSTDGRRRAPQEGGVAGLQAQAEGVAGDVGPVLVDDRHDAERHPDPARCAARSAAPSRRRPRRPGRAGAATCRSPAGHRLDARRREPQPVDDRGRASRPPRPRRRRRRWPPRTSSARSTSRSAAASRAASFASVDAVASDAAGRLRPPAELGDGGHGDSSPEAAAACVRQTGGRMARCTRGDARGRPGLAVVARPRLRRRPGHRATSSGEHRRRRRGRSVRRRSSPSTAAA